MRGEHIMKPYDYRTIIGWLCLLMLGMAGSSPAQQPTASVRQVTGEALISGRMPVRPGAALQAGDAIHTRTAATVTLEFSDGSILQLGSATTVELTEVARPATDGGRITSLYLRQGHIYVDASCAYRPERAASYNVETPNTMVESALQAQFEVRYEPAPRATTIIAHAVDLYLTDLHTYQTYIIPSGYTQVIYDNRPTDRRPTSPAAPPKKSTPAAAAQRSLEQREAPDGRQPAENPVKVQRSFRQGDTSEESRSAELPDYDGEYSFVPMREGTRPLEHYYDQAGIPNISSASKCSGEGDSRRCWPVIVNQRGDVLQRGSGKDILSISATGRYRDQAYGLVLSGQKYAIMDDHGDTERFRSDYREVIEGGRRLVKGFRKDREILDTIVDKNGRIIALTSKNIVSVSRDGSVTPLLSSTQRLTHGKLQNNADGAIAAIAVTVTDQILISNLQQWIITDLTLNKHGDQEKIFGVYPDSQQEVYGVVYKYVSPYNKGLYLLNADFRTSTSHSKILFNSEKRNVGFEPTIHTEGDMIIVNTSDSTNHKSVHFRLSKAEADTSDYEVPYARHLIDLREANERFLSFLVGSGTRYLLWQAASDVKMDDTTYAEASYDISDALLFSAQAEARLGKIRFVLSYLQNQAQKYTSEKAEELGGDLTKHASRFLLGALNFDGLISESSTLRLVAEYSEINGVATIEQEEQIVEDLLEFETKYQRFGVLYIRERGGYWGLDYTHYTMPSVIGFSDDSKEIVYTTFDSEFGMNKISFLGGYDKLASAKRYETNYNGLYLNGNFGLGIGWYDISDAIEKEAQNQTGTSKILQPGRLTLEGMVEIGYLFQRRSKALKGLGYVINVGYRGKGVFWSTGQFEDDEAIDADHLALEFNRGDLLHGPFVQVSLVF